MANTSTLCRKCNRPQTTEERCSGCGLGPVPMEHVGTCVCPPVGRCFGCGRPFVPLAGEAVCTECDRASLIGQRAPRWQWEGGVCTLCSSTRVQVTPVNDYINGRRLYRVRCLSCNQDQTRTIREVVPNG